MNNHPHINNGLLKLENGILKADKDLYESEKRMYYLKSDDGNYEFYTSVRLLDGEYSAFSQNNKNDATLFDKIPVDICKAFHLKYGNNTRVYDSETNVMVYDYFASEYPEDKPE